MTTVIPPAEWVDNDARGLLIDIGVGLTHDYGYATGGVYAKGAAWHLPIGPTEGAMLQIKIVTEPGDEELLLLQWILWAHGTQQVFACTRWFPTERIQDYWAEFEALAREHTLGTVVAALARLTRCTGCGVQESVCHNQQRGDLTVCCFRCHHPMTLRRTT